MLSLAEHQVYVVYPLLMQPVSKFWSSADHIGHSLSTEGLNTATTYGNLYVRFTGTLYSHVAGNLYQLISVIAEKGLLILTLRRWT
jgi:hypothetical protein